MRNFSHLLKSFHVSTIKFKLFRREHTVPLTDALPMLENMGLIVVGEQPHQLRFIDESQVWINDFSMTYAVEPTFEVEEGKKVSLRNNRIENNGVGFRINPGYPEEVIIQEYNQSINNEQDRLIL